MTHAFHPLFGQEVEFVKRRRNWRADRVYVTTSAGEMISLPAEWTDVVAPDPFVVVAGGRTPFGIRELLELSEIVERRRADGIDMTDGVQRISPSVSR